MVSDCTTSAAMMTGLRPTESESEPASSIVASSVMAYTPKTTVSVIGEKCHFAA